MSSIYRATLSLAALLLIFSASGSAQSAGDIASVISPGQVGGRPAGSAAQSPVDSVNLYNGNLNITIPLLAVGGRGEAGYTIVVPVQRRWSVDKNQIGPYPYSWLDAFSQLDYSGVTYSPGGLVIRRSSGTAGACLISGRTADFGPYLTRLVWTAPDGTQTVLRDAVSGGQPKGAEMTNCQAVSTYTPYDRQQTFVSSDGSDLTFVADQHILDSTSSAQNDLKFVPGWLYFPNGTKYRIDGNGNVTTMLDRNGNQTSLTYSNDNAGITDPLGRPITTTQTNAPAGTPIDPHTALPEPNWDEITYQGYGGASRTIKVNHDLLSNVRGQPAQTYQQLFPELSGASALSFNPDVIKSIVLPNGSSYSFQYNTYGEVVKMTLPTGGFIAYSYQQNYSCAAGSGGAGGDGVISISNYSGKSIYRRLTERDESADGTNLSSQTFYYACAGADPDPNHGSRAETTVTVDYNDPTQGLLRREKHFFYGDPSASNSLPGPTGYPDWSEGLEFRTEISDGSKTWQTQQRAWSQRPCAAGETCYFGDGVNDPNADNALPHDPQLCQVNTSLDDGQTAGQVFAYDRYNNVTDQFELGYGQAPPVGSGCPTAPGAFLRHTQNTYVTGTNYTSTAHLVSLLASSTVYDNPSLPTPIAQRSQSYDEQSPQSTPGIVGNDSASTTSQRGNVTTRNDWLNTTGANLATKYMYDVAGNVLTVTDPASNKTNYGYVDGNNTYAHVTSTTNAVGQTTIATYDYYTGLLQSTTDVNGVQTMYAYSNTADASLDRLKSITRAGLSTTAFSYPSLIQTTVQQDQDPLKNKYIISDQYLDGLGREQKTQQHEDSGSLIQVVKTYDALGRLHTVTNPFRPTDQQVLSTYTYDPLHRVINLQAPDQSSTAVQYSGNQATVQDAQGKARKLSTDALGRLTAVLEDPNGLKNPTSYGYDAQDNLTWVSQGYCPNCQSRWFTYDSLSRQVSASNPESGTTSYSYQDAQNQYQKTDARSVTTTYQFDGLNRLQKKIYSNATPAVTYTYDNSTGANTTIYTPGRLTRVTNGLSTKDYLKYDALGRLLQSQQTTAGTVFTFTYGYDAADALTAETYPSGRTVNTDYDTANRVSQVRNYVIPCANNQAITYAPQGDPSTFAYGNGLCRSYIYNSQLEPTSIQDVGNGLNLWSASLTWNNNRTMQSINTSHGATGSPASLSFAQSFTYDALNRLSTAADTGGWSRTFNYDPFGNRWVTTSEKNTLTVDPQTPMANGYNGNTNQINASSYDGAGNQIAVGSFSVWYDAENRQTQAYDNYMKAQANYVYDGDGQRVAKVSVSGTTVYVYDAFGRLATEYSSFTPAASPCQTCYLSWDHLGSTRLVTNDSGQVVSRHDFLPFGEDLGANGMASQAGRNGQWSVTDGVSQRFTGQERDDTGLDFFQARYYSSPFGRFTSPDPDNAGADLTDPQSWNAYAYVSNRPLTEVDPSGLQSCSGSCISYNPVPGAPSGNAPGAGSGFGFTLWESNNVPPPVQTLSAPYLPLQNTPFDAFIGMGKQALSDIVSGLSSFVNGDHPTEATSRLLWYLRPSTQRQQAGANILPFFSMAAVPFSGGAGEAKMGSLLPGEVRRIQQFVNSYNTEVYVVGSRAAGTAGEFSDFDYLIGGASKVRQAARRFLPKGKAGGEIRGYSETGIDIFNANKTPLVVCQG